MLPLKYIFEKKKNFSQYKMFNKLTSYNLESKLLIKNRINIKFASKCIIITSNKKGKQTKSKVDKRIEDRVQCYIGGLKILRRLLRIVDF
jgi:hypothetical protein